MLDNAKSVYKIAYQSFFFFDMCLMSVMAACSNADNASGLDETLADDFSDTTLICITEQNAPPSWDIVQGVVCQHEQAIRVVRGGETIALVRLGEPIQVAQAEYVEKWGYFQFPRIFRADDGNIIVYWQMKPDSQTSYGEECYEFRISKDEGKIWMSLDKAYLRRERECILLNNGYYIQGYTPVPKSISDYLDFPEKENEIPIKSTDFYLEATLPEDLQGVFFNTWREGDDNNVGILHGKLDDPGYLRYSTDGFVPVVWWGNLREYKNRLIAGVYPCYYKNDNGEILSSAISFYSSDDQGENWKILGSIFKNDSNGERQKFEDGEGFTEPAFEILEDGKYICVMRTSSTTPMYKALSKDGGKTWTNATPFAPNGVMPNLLLLKNGSLVLASGRPGLQLRFSFDEGQTWTQQLEMIPFKQEDGKFDIYGETCGYPSVLEVDDHSFYLVYSDFKTRNNSGEERKSIIFRKISIFRP